MGKTNLEMLLWGMAHIAKNHGFEYSLDYEEDGVVCIYGGCNVPTLADVKMLCEDVRIDPDCVASSSLGIDVIILYRWYLDVGKRPYEKGLEMWRTK